MITKEQEEKYLETGGIKCPFCGSDNINSTIDNTGIAEVICDDCGETWEETWKLVGIEHS